MHYYSLLIPITARIPVREIRGWFDHVSFQFSDKKKIKSFLPNPYKQKREMEYILQIKIEIQEIDTEN